MAGFRASGEILFQEKGNIGADGFGSKPVCTLGSEQHGSNLIEQRRILKGRPYPDRRQAAECGNNPARNGLSGIGDRDESLQCLVRTNDTEGFGRRRCATRVGTVAGHVLFRSAPRMRISAVRASICLRRRAARRQ